MKFRVAKISILVSRIVNVCRNIFRVFIICRGREFYEVSVRGSHRGTKVLTSTGQIRDVEVIYLAEEEVSHRISNLSW